LAGFFYARLLQNSKRSWKSALRQGGGRFQQVKLQPFTRHGKHIAAVRLKQVSAAQKGTRYG
jgi:hypothetical protein